MDRPICVMCSITQESVTPVTCTAKVFRFFKWNSFEVRLTYYVPIVNHLRILPLFDLVRYVQIVLHDGGQVGEIIPNIEINAHSCGRDLSKLVDLFE